MQVIGFPLKKSELDIGKLKNINKGEKLDHPSYEKSGSKTLLFFMK